MDTEKIVNALKRYGSGVMERGREMVRHPVDFYVSALRDVTPNPKGLMQSLGGIQSPEAEQAKQAMMNIALAGIGDPQATLKDEYNMLGYHGGEYPVTDFSKGPRRGKGLGTAFFTNSEDIARSYADTGEPPISGSKFRNGAVTKAHIKIENPLTENTDIRNIFDSPSDAFGWLDDMMSDRDRESIGRQIDENPNDESLWDQIAEAHYPGALAESATESFKDSNLLGSIAAGMIKYPRLRNYIQNRFDGLIYKDAEAGGKTIVPFNANQIKVIPSNESGK